jgi:excinuclease ABC subunit A
VATWAAKRGYSHLLVDREFVETAGFKRLERFKEHDIDLVVAELDALSTAAEVRAAVEEALAIGKGTLRMLDAGGRAQVLSSRAVSPATGRSFDQLDPRMFSYNSPHGWCPRCRGYGSVTRRRDAFLDPDRHDSMLAAELEEESRFSRADPGELTPCPDCQGARLNRDARAVLVQGSAIADLARLPVAAALQALGGLRFAGRDALVARDILPEITQRLHFMEHVGLGYLQLDRSATSLSGGEAQRIRLAAQLGSNLRGVLYVLDEPTIGLHPRDNAQLLDTLAALRDRGNSLLVVEHDPDTIRRADTLIDLGPGAGREGGQVVFHGPPSQLLSRAARDASPTARALSNPPTRPSRGTRRPLPAPGARSGWLHLRGARARNLQGIDVSVPVGRLTAITGVSGSGKSTLLRGVLLPSVAAALKRRTRNGRMLAGGPGDGFRSLSGADQIAAVYEVDQSPIGKTSRSCPATYVGVFDEVRKLFAGTPAARARGFDASRFSFNTEGGRCETCRGHGAVKLEMNFLPTTWVPCEDCNGRRYNAPTLEIDYHGKNIGDVMDMSIAEAAGFFATNPKVHRALQLLVETGTGYLQLGQPSPTLSGGEAQRIKLVTELTRGQSRAAHTRLRKNQTPKSNLYLIEEPTIGLHATDVDLLAAVLHRLADEGHTVVVIEHNLDLIAEADFVIDLGPEAGPDGGRLVATGPPETVAASPTSRTAPFLRQTLTTRAR